MLKKLFLGLIAAFSFTSAIAQCFEFAVSGSETWYPAESADAACPMLAPSNRDATPEPFHDGGRCYWKRNRDEYSVIIVSRQVECPKCQNDGPVQFTFFSGWGSLNSETSDNTVSPPLSYCDGVCLNDINASNPVEVCNSTVVGQFKKYTCQYNYNAIKDATCDTENGPDETEQPTGSGCPPGQTYGEVNGEPTCVPGGDNGGGDTGGGDTGGGDGGTGGETGGGDTGTGGGDTGTGGETGGGDTGTGTGSTGTGTATGTGPNGPINLELTLPDPCGAPGQPKCNVKLDESGTPGTSTANNAFGNALGEINGTQSDLQGAIANIQNGNQLPSWSWSFQLPAACSPLPLAAYSMTIDVCEFQPVIHDLMSLLWVAAGIFGLLALAKSAFEN